MGVAKDKIQFLVKIEFISLNSSFFVAVCRSEHYISVIMTVYGFVTATDKKIKITKS